MDLNRTQSLDNWVRRALRRVTAPPRTAALHSNALRCRKCPKPTHECRVNDGRPLAAPHVRLHARLRGLCSRRRRYDV